MSKLERRYEYKPKWTVIAGGGALFGLAAVFFAKRAVENQRGLIINGVIDLGLSGAFWFYGALCAASLGFVLIAVLLTYQRLRFRRYLVLGPTSLRLPAGRFLKNERSIEYRDILGLSLTEINEQRFLYIHHLEGKHTIIASMLPSRSTFNEVCELLATRTGADPGAFASISSGGPSFGSYMAWLTAMKIATLFAACGGPMIAYDVFKEDFDSRAAFALMFAPVTLILLGLFSLRNDEHDGMGRASVIGGLVGVAWLAAYNAYGIYSIAEGLSAADRGLKITGIMVGVLLSVWYGFAARRWFMNATRSEGS